MKTNIFSKLIGTGNNVDNYEVLSSVWILACNDDNSIITYKGIRYRLNLDDSFNLESLVSHRPDLFRLKVPANRITDWKNDMLNGGVLPSYIKILATTEEKDKAINAIKVESVFRSQFRTEKNAPISELEILEWGLQYINRLKQSQIEANEGRLKKANLFWLPIISLLVTCITLFSTIYSQSELKKYEVTFKPKQENYSNFMAIVLKTFIATKYKDRSSLENNINQLEITYFNIEPFLKPKDRIDIYDKYLLFTNMCMDYETIRENEELSKSSLIKANQSKYLDSLLIYKHYFRNKLYPALFQEDN